MKAVGYIPVSSEMQVKHGHSLDMQRKLITDYIQSKGEVFSDLFCESAYTAKLSERPALKRMLARTKRGEFDVIVVTSFDRFQPGRDSFAVFVCIRHGERYTHQKRGEGFTSQCRLMSSHELHCLLR